MEENSSVEELVRKSNELLKYQLDSYDTHHNKAATFISISSLFVPLSFSLFGTFHGNVFWIIIFFIPIFINLTGLYFLIKILKPKKLNFGISFNKFDDLRGKSKEEVQLIEIGANKDSFNDNATILSTQSANLKRGLTLIFLSSVVLSMIILIKYITLNICM